MTILSPTTNARTHLEDIRTAARGTRYKDLMERQTTEDLREFFRDVLCEDERTLHASINDLRGKADQQLGNRIRLNYEIWATHEADKAGDEAWQAELTRLIDAREI